MKEYFYGNYCLRVEKRHENVFNVTMSDLTEEDAPAVIWSRNMSKKRAEGVRGLFEAIGYFDIAF